ncbi:MAG TPA: helix-turn-helix transcriptional regulator [Lysobacter sp.]|nr:helix-turn-helix transcriptional regulator [Lysobacter sp.]
MHDAQGLALRLREERDRIGLNQADFAALGGVSRRTQAAYEAASTAPDVAYLSAIAAHGADVVYILTGRPAATVSSEESELLRRYRGASPEIRAAALAVLGTATAATQPTGGVTVNGGAGQVVSGPLTVGEQSFTVGGRKKGKRS